MWYVWQGVRVGIVVIAYKREQNTQKITADRHAFVIDYERDFSKRFKTQDSQACCNKKCHISGK
jgi:hypothetical protein